MKKIFSSAIFLLVFTFNVNAQADLSIHFFIYDNGLYPGSIDLIFGLDSTATDGVDPWLGESPLPPDACCGFAAVFCAAFILPPPYEDNAVWRDYRFGELPYTGVKQHRLFYCPQISTTLVTIECSLPSGVTALLQDPVGGTFVNIPMSGTNTYYLYAPYIFTTLNFTVTYNNVIPVELRSFTASCIDNSVHLKWETETETNNYGFEVQRTLTGEDRWQNIAFIPGRGTTTEPGDYSYIDENLPAGVYKYRLKQIDFDGSSTLSEEVKVEVISSGGYTLGQNYPNPFNPVTVINYAVPAQSRVSIRILDVLGNEIETLVDEEKPAGNYEVSWNAANYAQRSLFLQAKIGWGGGYEEDDTDQINRADLPMPVGRRAGVRPCGREISSLRLRALG